MNPRTQLAVAAAGVTLLSSTALHATFVDTGWVAPVVGAVLAVLIGAELGSRAGQHLIARSVWRFVGSALAALFYITAVWAHQGAFLGFIPRGHTWHLLRLLYDKAFTEVHDLPTPAPTYRALMLLTATGVALVAIAVDQLSVRAPLIGLPLLALYSVPEWLAKSGTGWIPLALGGGGYVGLLIREGRDRTNRWGRTVTGATTLGRNRSASGAMSQAGWRIGTAALAVALVVPPLIPDLGHFELAKGGGGISSSTVVHYDTWTGLGGTLRQSQTISLYSYTSSDGSGRYLRTGQADVFCSSCIRGGYSGFNAPDPVAEGGQDPTISDLAPGETPVTPQSIFVKTSVVIGPQLGQALLPIPIGTTKLDKLAGSWLYEQHSATVFSPDATATRNTRFTATSLASNDDPTEDQLEGSKLTAEDKAREAADLDLPRDLPAVVGTTAKSVVKGTRTQYEQAIAIQNWFTNGQHGFKYSLNAPTGTGYAPLIEFLTKNRAGFCQQYASAMVLLARSLGIPARVGLGFTVGTQSAGTFTVNNHDAHAWPELYFHDLGWVRFEPTPRTDNQTVTPQYAETTVAAIQAVGKPGDPNKVVAPNGTTAPPTGPRPAGEGGKTSSSAHHGGFSLPVQGTALAVVIVALVLLLLAVALPLAQRSLRKRRRQAGGDPREVALVAWREALRDAYDVGFVTSVADSPRQTARRLVDSATLSVTASESLHRLARAVEKARYALEPGEAKGLERDSEVVGAALYAAAPRRARIKAHVLPPSTTAAMGEAFSRFTSAVSRRASRSSERLVALGNRLVHRRSAPPVPPAKADDARTLVGSGSTHRD